MLTAFLANSGGRVLMPYAVDVVSGPTEDEVHFVDAEGKILVIFKRADVAIYTADGAKLATANEAPPAP
jgi:hypothetical protein